MQSEQIAVNDPVGLHARPAAIFVARANQFTADIQVCNTTSGSDWVNAKSILGILSCGVKQGDVIAIRAQGCDEVEAVDSLSALVRSDFAANPDQARL